MNLNQVFILTILITLASALNKNQIFVSCRADQQTSYSQFFSLLKCTFEFFFLKNCLTSKKVQGYVLTFSSDQALPSILSHDEYLYDHFIFFNGII